MALLTRGVLPSTNNFDMAYERLVGDPTLPFVLSSGMLEGLDDLAFNDALEEAGVDQALDLAGEDEIALNSEELCNVLGILNEMYLDGDEGAGATCEKVLAQLGFVWV